MKTYALVFSGSAFYGSSASVHDSEGSAVDALAEEYCIQLHRHGEPSSRVDAERAKIERMSHEGATEYIRDRWPEEHETPEIVEVDASSRLTDEERAALRTLHAFYASEMRDSLYWTELAEADLDDYDAVVLRLNQAASIVGRLMNEGANDVASAAQTV